MTIRFVASDPCRQVTRLICCFCCWLLCHPAHADFVLDVKNATITAGTNGSVDVTIRSYGSDFLSVASYRLRLERVFESNGTLQFADSFDSATPILKRQTANELSDPNYVFYKDSQLFSATRSSNDVLLFDGSDFASSDVPIDTNERLLARIELDFVTLSPLTASGSYRISLVQDDLFTLFENSNGPVKVNPISFDPLQSSGLITIVPAAVPEPSTSVLLGIGGCLLYARRRALRFVQGRSTRRVSEERHRITAR